MKKTLIFLLFISCLSAVSQQHFKGDRAFVNGNDTIWIRQDGTNAIFYATKPFYFQSSAKVLGTLAIGSIPATNGTLRLENKGIITARNAGNTANLEIINPGADDNIYYSNSTFSANPSSHVLTIPSASQFIVNCRAYFNDTIEASYFYAPAMFRFISQSLFKSAVTVDHDLFVYGKTTFGDNLSDSVANNGHLRISGNSLFKGTLYIGGTTSTVSTSQFILKGTDNAGATARTCMTLGNGGFTSPSSVSLESNGDKWVLWNSATYKGAIGFASSDFWFQSTSSAGVGKFTWYQGTTSPTQTMRLDAGKLALGSHTTINYAISLNGDAAKTIGIERNSTSNTAGNDLTLQGGGATLAATDKDGGMIVQIPGHTTGTGKTSVRTKRLDRAASTGTGTNSSYDAVIIPSVFNLTDGENNDLFEIALPDAGEIGAGIKVQFTIIATDANDVQTYDGVVSIVLSNDAGTLYESVVEQNANSDLSSGTLTTAWSVVNGTNKVTVRLVPTSSLTPTSFKCIYSIYNNSLQTINQL